jgi:Fe-S cluster assembly protein SufD
MQTATRHPSPGAVHWGEVDAPEWVQGLRLRGRQAFEAVGYPTPRLEDWKYTDVALIARGSFTRAVPFTPDQAAIQARLARLGIAGPRLVFLNGRFSQEASDLRDLPAAVRVLSVADGHWDAASDLVSSVADVDVHPFVALNTGQMDDVATVLVGRGALVDAPIHVVFLAAGSTLAAYPRVLIDLQEGAEATIIETYAALDDEERVSIPLTELRLGDDSRLAHGRVVLEGDAALHVGVVEAALGRAATLRSLHVAAASRLTRTDLNVRFGGEGAECTLNGLYVASAGRHVDTHTLIDHAMPHCTSRELYKGIVGNESTGVFNGKVIVRPGAQKTNAGQTNRNLLLSNRATVDTKPQLEIFADDVKCTHGAAVGPPDPETLFYLRSRGLDPTEAARLYAYGFGADVLAGWPLRDRLEPIVIDRIDAAVRSSAP